MKVIKILLNKNFTNARIIVYFSLIVSYIILKFFYKVKCIGCPLCGMTRAITSLLHFKFIEAYNYNNNVIFILIIIIFMILDFLFMLNEKSK